MLASIIGYLVLRNQKLQDERYRAMEPRVTQHGAKIDQIDISIRDCKVDCHREFVTAESFVRSESYTRKKLDQVLEGLAGLTARVQVADKLPEIAGNIAREIVAHMSPPNRSTP